MNIFALTLGPKLGTFIQEAHSHWTILAFENNKKNLRRGFIKSNFSSPSFDNMMQILLLKVFESAYLAEKIINGKILFLW